MLPNCVTKTLPKFFKCYQLKVFEVLKFVNLKLLTMIVPNLTLIYDRKKVATKERPSVVEIKISAEKERKYISTGIKLYPKEWKDGQVVARTDAKELNEQLYLLRKKCSDIISQMITEGTLDIAAVNAILRHELQKSDTFLQYARSVAERRYKKIAKGTRRNYEVVFDFLTKWGGIISFADVTERNILRMDEALKDRGLKECSRWNYHKLVKTFAMQAVEEGFIKRNPYTRLDIKRGNESGLTRYLTPAEFHRFESCKIDNECLRKVRDLFVFQTYTMMSYSDLERFDYKKCEKMNGQMVYKSNRVKTKQEFVVVLLKPALAILQRYDYKLPIISNVKYNAYLKAAVLYAHIDKPISTHWARHTGATMLLNEKKIPIQIIQHILGHASIRETEKTYAKLMDETIVNVMAKV